MGLTVSYFRPNVNQNMQAGKGDLNEDNLGSLAQGIGAYNKYKYRMKAADLMEGKGKAQDRINEIDAEIAELENKLNEYEQARQQDAQRVQASQAASQQMEGYAPTAEPTTDEILAAQYAAKRNWENAGNPAALKYGTAINPHATNSTVDAGFAGDLTEMARQNAMRAAAQGKYRWRR